MGKFIDYNAMCPLKGGRCNAKDGCAFAVTVKQMTSREYNYIKCAIAVIATGINDKFYAFPVGKISDHEDIEKIGYITTRVFKN